MQFNRLYIDDKLREEFNKLFDINFTLSSLPKLPKYELYLEFYIPSLDKIFYLRNYLNRYHIEDVNLIYKEIVQTFKHEYQLGGNIPPPGGGGAGGAGSVGSQYHAGIWAPVGPNTSGGASGSGGGGGFFHPKYTVNTKTGTGGSGNLVSTGNSGNITLNPNLFTNPLSSTEMFVPVNLKSTGIYDNVMYGFKPTNIARENDLTFRVLSYGTRSAVKLEASHYTFIVTGNIRYSSDIITGLGNDNLSNIYFTMIAQCLFKIFHAYNHVLDDNYLNIGDDVIFKITFN